MGWSVLAIHGLTRASLVPMITLQNKSKKVLFFSWHLNMGNVVMIMIHRMYELSFLLQIVSLIGV